MVGVGKKQQDVGKKNNIIRISHGRNDERLNIFGNWEPRIYSIFSFILFLSLEESMIKNNQALFTDLSAKVYEYNETLILPSVLKFTWS